MCPPQGQGSHEGCPRADETAPGRLHPACLLSRAAALHPPRETGSIDRDSDEICIGRNGILGTVTSLALLSPRVLPSCLVPSLSSSSCSCSVAVSLQFRAGLWRQPAASIPVPEAGLRLTFPAATTLLRSTPTHPCPSRAMQACARRYSLSRSCRQGQREVGGRG